MVALANPPLLYVDSKYKIVYETKDERYRGRKHPVEQDRVFWDNYYYNYYYYYYYYYYCYYTVSTYTYLVYPL